MTKVVVAPPRDLGELLARATALTGRTLGELARALAFDADGAPVRTKGKGGELLERALGATGGPHALHDFPDLGVELKTIPVTPDGKPRESTFVCALSLTDADRATWEEAWARAKLSCVLWVPVVTPVRGGGPDTRRVGAPLLWRPTPAQEDVLRADFDDLVGAIGMGGIEGVSAHQGRWLQIRPKAADSQVRTRAYGPDGEPLDTVPRGFYLRARFTGAILEDPEALPL